MSRLCTHHACRCDRAAELAAIADRTRRAVYLAAALEVHEQEVVCRRPELQIRDVLRPRLDDDQIYAWLNAGNVELENRIPALLLAAGDVDQVLEAARRLANV